MVMYDTLCRHFIPSYGNDWVKAPNFERLAKRSVQFDNFYVGSMPCMPARREMHTGRYNFLHRSWGPLEPFDDSMPEILDMHGIHSHKVTDHQHYWEDGGATYHQRYTTFDLVRGQEGDKWIGDVEKLRDPSFGSDRWPEHQRLSIQKQDMINREHMVTSDLQPQHITFDLGLQFIERNKDADRWFLQIETFDPHEPFFSQKEFQDLYPHEYLGPPFDWPPYREIREDRQTVDHIRYLYASLVSFCDEQLGRVLDVFDRHNLWEDTLLLVNTDHGFLMGEHDWWAKNRMPMYNEIAHIPLFIHHPEYKQYDGETRNTVTQNIDLMPTFLSINNLTIPKEVKGKSLLDVLDKDSDLYSALYGYWGGGINITDGKYTYFYYPENFDQTSLKKFQYTFPASLHLCHQNL